MWIFAFSWWKQGIRRVLTHDVLNQQIVTALIPPLFLGLLGGWYGGWYLPKKLHQNSLQAEALKQRAVIELETVRELHAVVREFFAVRLDYDAAALRCSETNPVPACVEEALVALRGFAQRWEERSGYYQLLLTAYMGNTKEAPEVHALNAMRAIVDSTIRCLYREPGGLPTTDGSCSLLPAVIEQTKLHLKSLSENILRDAREHSAGDHPAKRESLHRPP